MSMQAFDCQRIPRYRWQTRFSGKCFWRPPPHEHLACFVRLFRKELVDLQPSRVNWPNGKACAWLRGHVSSPCVLVCVTGSQECLHQLSQGFVQLSGKCFPGDERLQTGNNKQVLRAVFRSCDVLSWIRGVTLKSYAYGEWTCMPDIERHSFGSATPVGQMPRTTLGTKNPGQSCAVRPGSPAGP